MTKIGPLGRKIGKPNDKDTRILALEGDNLGSVLWFMRKYSADRWCTFYWRTWWSINIYRCTMTTLKQKGKNEKIPCGFKILLPSSNSTLEINAINLRTADLLTL